MQYATAADGVRIAYAVAGSGPWLVRMPSLPFSHVQLEWRDSDFYASLTRNITAVAFDARGTGLSDRDARDLSLDARIGDVEAVVDRVGIDHFALHAAQLSGPTAIAYAVRHPERVSHLILDDTFACARAFMQMPHNRALRELVADDWESTTESLAFMYIGHGDADVARYAAFFRACVTQEMARRIMNAIARDDVTGLLQSVRAPTLVLQHAGLKNLPPGSGRELAAGIPGARLQMLSGSIGDAMETVVSTVGEFIGAHPVQAPAPAPRDDSVFRAILFTDIVAHTDMMRRLGDEAGRAVLRDHERITRDVLATHGGVEVKTDGDSFMASFTSAASAAASAVALQRAFADYNRTAGEPIHVRAGINAGEPIAEAGDYFGASVILAARISALAAADEVLVSVAVRELCAGKQLRFSDRGTVELKGFDEPISLYELHWRHM